MATGMRDCNHEQLLFVGNECDVVWKSGKIDTPIARRAQPPKQWMLNNRNTDTLHRGTKSDTKAHRASLVIACDALDLRKCLREKLEHETHLSGAICRSRVKTFFCWNGFGIAGLKACDTSNDLILPCSFDSWLWLEIYALQKLTCQCKTLVGWQSECVMSDGIKCGRHWAL